MVKLVFTQARLSLSLDYLQLVVVCLTDAADFTRFHRMGSLEVIIKLLCYENFQLFRTSRLS